MYSKSYKATLYFFSFLIIVASIFPFYWAIVTSFKSGSDLFKTDFWPPSFSLKNYIEIFDDQPFGKNILNSLVTAVGTVSICLALAVSASYSLGRVRFKGRSLLLLSILCVSMFPQVAVLSGMFELIRSLGLYNTVYSLMLSYMIFTLPFTVWILTTFMKQLPKEIEESAIIDGASSFTICFKIFLPLLWPALITTGLLAFIAAWNEFLFALTFTVENQSRTVPVAIALMTGSTEHDLPWGKIMAASVMVTVPLIIMVMIFQRRIVSGLTAGAVKG